MDVVTYKEYPIYAVTGRMGVLSRENTNLTIRERRRTSDEIRTERPGHIARIRGNMGGFPALLAKNGSIPATQ